MENKITKNQQFYIDRYHFIHNELSRLQNDMSEMEKATSKLLFELQELRSKEIKEIEKDGEI